MVKNILLGLIFLFIGISVSSAELQTFCVEQCLKQGKIASECQIICAPTAIKPGFSTNTSCIEQCVQRGHPVSHCRVKCLRPKLQTTP